MMSACTSVHWASGDIRTKLPFHHQNILAQSAQTNYHQPVIFLEKRPNYRLSIVAALEDALGQKSQSSLMIGDDGRKLTSDFDAVVTDCPPWFKHYTKNGCWRFGTGTTTICETARIHQLLEKAEKYDSVHIAGFDIDPEAFVELASKLQSVSKKITWYPFRMFPREHPFIRKIVIPAIHKKALFLAR